MHLGEYIESIRKENGHTKIWLAEKSEISYKTFVDKLKNDTFTAKELFRIAIVLGIDLEQLKNDFKG